MDNHKYDFDETYSYIPHSEARQKPANILDRKSDASELVITPTDAPRQCRMQRRDDGSQRRREITYDDETCAGDCAYRSLSVRAISMVVRIRIPSPRLRPSATLRSFFHTDAPRQCMRLFVLPRMMLRLYSASSKCLQGCLQ